MSVKVLVVGAGAIGTLIAYAVYASTGSVDIVFKDDSNFSNLSKEGCKVVIDGVEKSFKPKLHTWNSIKDKYDVVILSTKAYDIPKYIDRLEKLLKSDSIILSIQNGIGSYELLRERFPDTQVYCAVVYYGAVKKGSCVSEVTGKDRIIIGDGPEIDVIVRLLEPYLNIEVVDNIAGFRWLKTLVNAGINPVTVIFKDRNKVVLENRWANELARRAVQEGLKVVNRIGVTLPYDPIETMYEVARKTGDNISSMLQDVLAGRETEIDYINGAIVRYGEKLKIDTPVNSFLVLVVRGLSEWRRSP